MVPSHGETSVIRLHPPQILVDVIPLPFHASPPRPRPVRELDEQLRAAIENNWDDLDSADFLYSDTLACVYADSVGHLGYHTWLQRHKESLCSTS